MLSRRHFLAAGSAALASNLFGAPGDSKSPSAELEKLGGVALAEAKKYKASYADVRIVRLRSQSVSLRAVENRVVPGVSEDGSFGFGVRVIVNGAWGFASSPVVTAAEIARITGEAVVIAKANAAIQSRPVQLAPVKAYRDRWVTPHEKDPFDIALEEKIDLLHRVTAQVKKNERVF